MNLGELEFSERELNECEGPRMLAKAEYFELLNFINQRLKEKLESAPLLYGDPEMNEWSDKKETKYDTCTARLVCIEPFERDSMEKLIEDLAEWDGAGWKPAESFVIRAKKLKGGK